MLEQKDDLVISEISPSKIDMGSGEKNSGEKKLNEALNGVEVKIEEQEKIITPIKTEIIT